MREVVRQSDKAAPSGSLQFVAVDASDGDSLRHSVAQALESNPTLIVASSGEIARAVKQQTTRVPIVFMSHADPLTIGVVDRLYSSGSNATGITFSLPADLKRLELVRDVLPQARSVGILLDKWAVEGMPSQAEIDVAEKHLGLKVQMYPVSTRDELDRFKAGGAALRHDVWYVHAGYIAWLYSDEIVAFFNAHGKPTVYGERRYVALGGLMAIQPIPPDAPRQLAWRILAIRSGMPPGAIPIERPKGTATFFNVVTARQLGISIPRNVLGRARHVFRE